MDQRPSSTRNLGIGEAIISENNNEVIWTVLGSCISVILHVPKVVSLICHAQLPSRENYDFICSDSCPKPCGDLSSKSMDFKYVKCSLEYMIGYLNEHNYGIHNLHTTLIGGAVINWSGGPEKSIGEQNAEMARTILRDYGIGINRALVGGESGLTFWYYTQNNRLVFRRHEDPQKYELLDKV